MNIWIFNHYAVTPRYPGGTRHFELGKQLSLHGHKVTIFASNFNHMAFSHIELTGNRDHMVEDFGDLCFVWERTPGYTSNNWKRLWDMIKYNRVTKRVSGMMVKNGELEKPDIIIGSIVHPFAPLLASKLAKKYGATYIFEIRDLWPQTFIDMGIWKASSPLARFFKAVEKRSIANARKVIALSPRTADYLKEQYNYSPDDVCYIPNGSHADPPEPVEGSVNEGETPAALAQLKEKDVFIALFSGSIIASNRLEVVINAAEQLKDEKRIRLLMIGRGQEESAYRELIEDKKLDNITILPPVKKFQVPHMLKQADVLILNQGNVQWGSMNKLYDYMASGRPIISGVHARHNDVVTEVGGGISIPANDSNELATAIRKMYELPKAEREAMGKKNNDFVRQNHDWKVLGKKLSTLIDTLFSKTPV